MNENEQKKKIGALVKEAGDLVEVVRRHLLSSGIGRSAKGQSLVDVEELKAYGAQGLVEAAQRFDVEQGADFRRFAYFRVRGAMIDGLRKMGNWSRRGYERVSMLRALDSALSEEQSLPQSSRPGGSPASKAKEAALPLSDEQRVARERKADMAAEKLRQHMSNMVTAMLLGVFATPVREGDEIVGLSSEPAADDLVYEAELRKHLHQALKSLGEPERSVIERHYLQGESLLEIGRSFGHTKSWASRQHTSALRRLQFRLRESS